MSSILQVRSLSKSFGEHKVLDSLDFDVQRGEAVAIIGSSGSGKTTLLNILGLLEGADSGTVSLLGLPNPQISSHAAMLLRRKQINYLFQSFALIDSMTVRQNLMLALRYCKQSKEKKHKQIMGMLGSCGIDDKVDSVVNELSGGEKQRVAISRALLKPGSLILADEPTGSLDRRMASAVMGLLTDSTRLAQKTLIVVTHDMDMAARCGRVLRLENGRLA